MKGQLQNNNGGTRRLNHHYQSSGGRVLGPAFDALITGFPIMQLPVISGTLSLSTSTGALRIYVGNRAGLNSLVNAGKFTYGDNVPLYLIAKDTTWEFGGLKLSYLDIKRYLENDTRFVLTEEPVTFELYPNNESALYNTVTIDCLIVHYAGRTLSTSARIYSIPGVVKKPRFITSDGYYGVKHKYSNLHIFSQDGTEGIGDITKTNLYVVNQNVNTKWNTDFTFTEDYVVPPEVEAYFSVGGLFEYTTEASEVEAFPRDQLIYGNLFDDSLIKNDVSPATLRGGNYTPDSPNWFQGVCKVYCDSFTYTDTRNARVITGGNGFGGSVLGTTANYLRTKNRE